MRSLEALTNKKIMMRYVDRNPTDSQPLGRLPDLVCGALSADLTLLVTLSKSGRVYVWDLQRSQQRVSLCLAGPLHDCAWLPDNKHLVVVGKAGVYFLRFVCEPVSPARS
jgi:hypothetical protein